MAILLESGSRTLLEEASALLEENGLPDGGHGDAAGTGSAALTVTSNGVAVALTGHGDASTTGTGAASLAAAFAAKGSNATAGTGGLQAALVLGSHGDAASTGTGALSRTASLGAHGDGSSAGAGPAKLAAALAAHGDAATSGTASATVTTPSFVALQGAGAACSAGAATNVLTLVVSGHGDAASAGSLGEAPSAAVENTRSGRRNRILTVTVRFVYPLWVDVTVEITTAARTRCTRSVRTRAANHPISTSRLVPGSSHDLRVVSEADRLRDDIEAITALLQLR